MKCPIHGDVCEFVSDRYFCQHCGFSWTTAEILKYEKLTRMEDRITRKIEHQHMVTEFILGLWIFITTFFLMFLCF